MCRRRTPTAPPSRMTVTPGECALAVVGVARACQVTEVSGEGVFIEVLTHDPVCKSESAPVRVADVPRQSAAAE